MTAGNFPLGVVGDDSAAAAAAAAAVAGNTAPAMTGATILETGVLDERTPLLTPTSGVRNPREGLATGNVVTRGAEANLGAGLSATGLKSGEGAPCEQVPVLCRETHFFGIVCAICSVVDTSTSPTRST